jgi:hypothetical protein
MALSVPLRGSRHRPGVAEFYRWATLRFEHYIR